jgi:uncharacterized membrane protein YgcG
MGQIGPVLPTERMTTVLTVRRSAAPADMPATVRTHPMAMAARTILRNAIPAGTTVRLLATAGTATTRNPIAVLRSLLMAMATVGTRSPTVIPLRQRRLALTQHRAAAIAAVAAAVHGAVAAEEARIAPGGGASSGGGSSHGGGGGGNHGGGRH